MAKPTTATRERLLPGVRVRLAESDAEAVATVAASLGTTQSAAIRLMLRRYDGAAASVRAARDLHAVRDELDSARDAVNATGLAIQRVGNNANQIARAVNGGDPLDVAAVERLTQRLEALQAQHAETARALTAWVDADLRAGVQ
ncbi:plasmid mobilization relaxosome protein MobC [Leucobacter chromiireducens]|nr:plasmid mobilization relaxosome protein MobC [Leucobacter chromiireducens]